MNKRKMKKNIVDAFLIIGGIGAALCIGVLLAVPLMIKAEIAFSLIDFLGR
jgi:hypothetical protein